MKNTKEGTVLILIIYNFSVMDPDKKSVIGGVNGSIL